MVPQKARKRKFLLNSKVYEYFLYGEREIKIMPEKEPNKKVIQRNNFGTLSGVDGS